MLSKLKKKFILTIMLLVGSLLTGVLVVTCIYNYQNLHSELISSMKNAIGFNEDHEPGPRNQQGNPPPGIPDNPKSSAEFNSLNIPPPQPVSAAADNPESSDSSSGTDTNSSADETDQRPKRPLYTPRIGNREDKPDMAYTAVVAVNYSKNTGEIEIISNSNANIDESILEDAVQRSLSERNREGYIDEYGLIYYRSPGSNMTDTVSVAFANSAYITNRMANYIFASLMIGIIAMGFIFIISWFVATQAIKPIEKVWDEQRRFIADASHELKTPLTVMMANFSIMKLNRSELISDNMKWLESSEAESAQMSELINDMLMLAQSESGIREDSMETVDLSSAVTGAVLQFEALAYENNISLTDNVESEIMVNGSPAKIRRMVMTLVDNAVKYEPKGGRVTVSLTKHHDKAELSVINQLSKIDDEDIPHLFERFYRKRNDQTKNGYGLGLAIAKSIAESHGGTIAAVSSASGTVFTVTLKRALRTK